MDQTISPESGASTLDDGLSPATNSNSFDESLSGKMSGFDSDKEVLFNAYEDEISFDGEPLGLITSTAPTQNKRKLVQKRSSRSQIAPAKWETVKGTIAELYLEKDYTLATVMEIMSKPPYDFHATLKMYKSQFKIWGFAKNLTRNKVNRFMNTNTVKEKFLKTFSAARIDQYLKRRKTSHDTTAYELEMNELEMNDLETDKVIELPGFGVPAELENSQVFFLSDCGPSRTCKLHGRGRRKFAIDIEDMSKGYPIWYFADSWGKQAYYGLEERKCPSDCACRFLCGRSHFDNLEQPHRFDSPHQHTHLFRAVCREQSIAVDIYNLNMIINLGKIIGETESLSDKWPIPLQYGTGINGITLLKHYRKLKDFLDNPNRDIWLPVSDILDLKLLVEGLLEDADVWDRIGIETLHDLGVLDPSLLNTFLHRRLIRGIRSLDSVFKTADAPFHASKGIAPPQDNEIEFEVIHELDSTPALVSHFHVPTWEYHQRQNRGVVDSSSAGINSLPEELLCRLPEHFMLDSFHDDLPQDFPQLLPTVSRGPNFPIIFSEELNNFHSSESFVSTEPSREKQQQADLDVKLVSACKHGILGAVQSLLDQGASPNCQVRTDNKTYSPLIAAIESSNETVVRHLVFKGANLNDKAAVVAEGETLLYTALLAATRTNQCSIINFLLERGADINELSTSETATARRTFTAMSEAARLELMDAFKLLLLWDTSYSAGLKQTGMISNSDPESKEVKQLFDAVKSGSSSSLIRIMGSIRDPNILTFEGTPLSLAAQCNQPHKIKILLEHGADVQLASLYLSRSGQQKIAKVLVKTVYGSQNVRTKFVRQYERLVSLSQSSRQNNLKSFKRHCYNYRQAWSVGLEVMEDICRGKAPDGPDCLHKTLALLAVARAVAETSVGDNGDIRLLDKFDTDLLRWQLLFPNEEDLAPYRFTVRELWKVDLSEKLFLDLDFDDSDTLGRFNGLISRLLDGARRPLDLDKSHSNGLNESFSRWKLNRSGADGLNPHSAPMHVAEGNQRREDAGYHLRLETMTRNIVPVTCDKKMSREQILKTTRWLNPSSGLTSSICFFDFTTVAEDLLRGVIFSIVFVFIHGWSTALFNPNIWECIR
ncbi:hypothetical protein BKA67DRAFT_665200 [Truncatella angustata]|uniref:Clr5 domain-containing protein n=1 Tax=Truncatella angustata TaxID=152316 RepID=A0A9P8RF98_9PEZI|nr:uncharacterized protein BKA67DRAFT_665200 [Truncatella angustata]KAH6643386.1 hypothetical protein BKA67DRAFT_665200 [Truncatella angustata]